MTDTTLRTGHDPARRALETKLNTALPEAVDRSAVLSRAASDWDGRDLLPLETLREAVEVELPTFLAEKAVEAQIADELADEETRNQHRRRFARIKDAILGGLGETDRGELVTPDALASAKAQAEAEAAHAELEVQGAQQRIKNAAALAKTQAKAVVEVRKALPVLDEAALDAAVADAVAAIERAVAVRTNYADQVTAMGETLLAGGFERYDGFGTPEGGTGVASSHVLLDHEVFAARDVTRQAFAELADAAAKAAK
ncbi:hypothetical protein [Rhodococcus koreensis]|uniref:hypothetical protein n=1 Tax=Rhodococcus koreensis TaxID=99653 RepID=UPI00366C38A2